MYKLVALFSLLAVCAAAPAPKPQVFYSPAVLSPVAHVGVVPAVTSYSSYSSSVIHPPTIPVVRTQLVHAAPVVHASPVVHAGPVVPVAYHAPAAYYI